MSKMNKKKFFLYICLTIIILLTGCAPRLTRPPGGYQRLKSQSFLIDNQRYISLASFCQAYALDWKWSSVSQHLFLSNPHLYITLRCDSSIALVNGNVEYLPAPLLMKKSNVIIPLALAKTIDTIYTREPKERLYRLKTVVIDAGHGGRDPGAIGRNGLKEKDVVLDIALKLKRLLESENIKVVMTRETDNFVSLWRRAYIANNSGADFFISIHANASRSRYSYGFEVYYLSNAIDNEARAVAAAENAALQFEESSIDTQNVNLNATLWDLVLEENRTESLQMADILCKTASKELRIKDRGVKTARFYVLKGVHTPAVLVEVGFITNRYEEKQLKGDFYRRQIAQALALGIMEYKRVYESTNGFAN
jgi:N-acetylmuramoyl-L-alanine amidase